MAFMSRRQVSLFVLVGSFVFAKLLVALIDKYDKGGTEQAIKAITSILGKIITILLTIIVCATMYKGKINSPIVSTSSYPVEACDYILENVDIENMRIFNEYNYGSYLLYRGIPVFIDSRADLYTPEFSGREDEDIFSDFLDVSSIGKFYEDIFEKYGITHVITYENSKMNMIIRKTNDSHYNQIYGDDYFVVYERIV